VADGGAHPLDEPLFSLEDLVMLTGLSYHSLWREVHAGRLRASKRCGRWVVRRDWYDEWLTAGVHPPPDPARRGAPAEPSRSVRPRRSRGGGQAGTVDRLTAIEGGRP
jgi:hypothetical protein